MAVGNLAAAESLALNTLSVTTISGVGTRGGAYVVLQGIQVVVRIQLETNISVLNWAVDSERAYVVLLLGVLPDLQILVVHLQGIHRAEIQENPLAVPGPQLPQPVHLVQQAVLSQQVYLCLAQQLT